VDAAGVPLSATSETTPAPSAEPANVSRTAQDYTSAPTVYMKGGTTSSRYDNALAQKEADAERRRKAQDRMRSDVEGAVGQGAIGGLHEMRMVTQDSGKLWLQYLNDDGSTYQDCVSEITVFPDPFGNAADMMFTLVCPKCVERGVPMGESQIMVRSSHRKWWLDETKRGVVAIPTEAGPMILHQAGHVTVQDIIRCSNFNCTWSVRIDGNKVRRA
jgi:hypothetical protein